MDCLVCDRPTCGIVTLIERLGACAGEDIGARERLVTLALDCVGHVADLAKDPAQVRGWLEAASSWRRKPQKALLAEEEATKARNEAIEGKDKQAMWVLQAVAWATWAAKKATEGESQVGWVVAATTNTVNTAASAQANSAGECAWQFEHLKELACTCPSIPEVGPPGERCRDSLLAH